MCGPEKDLFNRLLIFDGMLRMMSVATVARHLSLQRFANTGSELWIRLDISKYHCVNHVLEDIVHFFMRVGKLDNGVAFSSHLFIVPQTPVNALGTIKA